MKPAAAYQEEWPEAPAGSRPDAASPARRIPWLALATACVVAIVTLAPVLHGGFFGDDYDLWHVGRQVIADPSLLLIGPGNFYRPANAWLFAGNQLLFGPEPFAYHLGTLLLHLTCGVLLGLLLHRNGLSSLAVLAGSCYWLCSPYTFEPVLFVNVAYNDLTVHLVWLALAVLWPGPGVAWRTWRLCLCLLLLGFSVFCKESWVIIVLLAPAYELWLARRGLRRAVRTGLILTVPVVGYLVIYQQVFGDRMSYYEPGAHMLIKIPHLWACFAWLDRLDPFRPSLTAGALAGTVLLLACLVLAWRLRSRLAGLGLVLYGAALLPVLAVVWIPTRYTTVPMAGFVLAMAGILHGLVRRCPEHRRQLLRLGIGVTVTLALLTNLVWLRGELNDMERLRAAHDRLLTEARACAGDLPVDRALVCVRAGNRAPLAEIAHQGYAGLVKPQYQRATSPDGLISWAALLTYVRTGLGNELLIDQAPAETGEQLYAVLLHDEHGFHLQPPQRASLADEVAAWRGTGLPVRLVVPWVERSQHRSQADREKQP